MLRSTFRLCVKIKLRKCDSSFLNYYAKTNVSNVLEIYMEDKCNNHILFSIPIFVTIVQYLMLYCTVYQHYVQYLLYNVYYLYCISTLGTVFIVQCLLLVLYINTRYSIYCTMSTTCTVYQH